MSECESAWVLGLLRRCWFSFFGQWFLTLRRDCTSTLEVTTCVCVTNGFGPLNSLIFFREYIWCPRENSLEASFTHSKTIRKSPCKGGRCDSDFDSYESNGAREIIDVELLVRHRIVCANSFAWGKLCGQEPLLMRLGRDRGWWMGNEMICDK